MVWSSYEKVKKKKETRSKMGRNFKIDRGDLD